MFGGSLEKGCVRGKGQRQRKELLLLSQMKVMPLLNTNMYMMCN